MKNSLRTQMYSRLNLKDTEELLEIWRNHDTNEWIDEVFEVAEEILVERLGELPGFPVNSGRPGAMSRKKPPGGEEH